MILLHFNECEKTPLFPVSWLCVPVRLTVRGQNGLAASMCYGTEVHRWRSWWKLCHVLKKAPLWNNPPQTFPFTTRNAARGDNMIGKLPCQHKSQRDFYHPNPDVWFNLFLPNSGFPAPFFFLDMIVSVCVSFPSSLIFHLNPEFPWSRISGSAENNALQRHTS